MIVVVDQHRPRQLGAGKHVVRGKDRRRRDPRNGEKPGAADAVTAPGGAGRHDDLVEAEIEDLIRPEPAL